jgi:hypothetical protein
MADREIEERLRYLNTLALLGAALVLLIVVGAISVMVYLSVNVNQAATSVKDLVKANQATLCGLKENIEDRITASENYLRDNPQGVVSPKSGAIIITAAEIRVGIQRDKLALRKFSPDLDCSA